MNILTYDKRKLSVNDNITEDLVEELIAEQFPELSHLPIKKVSFMGHDNRMFHLGSEMLIRCPSNKNYAMQVLKEQKWLPKISEFISFPIPRPLFLGKASKKFPYNWSIYNFLEGDSVNSVTLDDAQLENLAFDLVKFLNELYKIEISNAPVPGVHNYWRGCSPIVYDDDSRMLITKYKEIIDYKNANKSWEKAISSKWTGDPLWLHGDFASGNLLVKEGKLSAVIDFGCAAVGDPACDLVIAWTLFKEKSRKIFMNNMNLDSDTWNRARGWALWKALVTLDAIDNKEGEETKKQLEIINEVINE